ncbi:hypothetical protein F2Q70_00026735 [Brassica cretica]|uniref:Retrotransposon gag domain-containing protein n=1 Tax=Brassica cretica TaxID=69181 RepID=A0A8S9LB88_BRACR|nr:hypothetical protein F2Q70_00026735 [Brassica cretica]
MVQDAARQAAHEAVQQAVQEAARVAAQEVVRQMAAAQQGQQVPPVQAQGHQQPPIQQVPGVFQVPPPAPLVLPGQVPEVDETPMRVMRQMKIVDLETFGGTIHPGAAYNWKHRLASCLQTINCPLRLCLNITELYLRGDALVWWDGVRSMRDGDMTYEEFLIAFDKKYFPKEALHQKRNAFEHLRQGRLDQEVLRWYASRSPRQVQYGYLYQFRGSGREGCGAGGMYCRGAEVL